MEVIFALTGKDFCITATDNTAAQSIVVQKRGNDKSYLLNKHNLMVN